jgi:hypothetical protein
MVMAVARGLVIAAAVVAVLVAMFIAVIIGAHSMMIIRSVLGACDHRRQCGHGNGRQGK